MVNEEYFKGNNRFFLYVDMDEEKIRGNYNDEMIEYAIEQYVNENHSDLTKALMVQKDAKNKKKYTADSAKTAIKKRLIQQYFWLIRQSVEKWLYFLHISLAAKQIKKKIRFQIGLNYS